MIRILLASRSSSTRSVCAKKTSPTAFYNSVITAQSKEPLPNNQSASYTYTLRCMSTSVTSRGIYQEFSSSTPVLFAQETLQAVHNYTHLPWWATIILSTVALRALVTFPLTVYQHNKFGKLELTKIEMDGLVKELKRETAIAIKKFKWTNEEAKRHYNNSVKKQWDKLVQKNNCHPGQGFVLLLVQLPLFVIMTLALRNMATMEPFQTTDALHTFASMSMEGFGWIPNLTVGDKSFILPVTMASFNLAITELQTMCNTAPLSRLGKYRLYILRGLSLVIIPIAAYFPSAVSLYWTTSSAYGLVQNLILLSPKVRRKLRIPLTPSEITHPYRRIREKLMGKLAKLK